MLTTPQIKEYAVRGHTSAANIAREYCQHLFLSSFYQQPIAQQLFFKGGTALRIIYHSPRFSEDLDFDSPHKDINRIEQGIVGALAAMEALGITTELTEATTTSGGYLAAANFRLTDYHVESQLEISLRSSTGQGDMVTVVNEYIPTYTIAQLTQDQLVAGKLNALLSRRKPRDFYDLYFMLRANLLSLEQRTLLSQALAALQQTKTAFEPELKEFLPRHQWAIIRDLPAAVEREIKRFL